MPTLHQPTTHLGAPTTAATITAAIIERRRDQASRSPLLLFFAQGHHLADTGTPLFTDPIHATTAGVRIDTDPTEPHTPLGDRHLGYIGYTLNRYADMTDADLQSLVRASTAWHLARTADGDTPIELAWISDWFRRAVEAVGRPGADDLAELAAFRRHTTEEFS